MKDKLIIEAEPKVLNALMIVLSRIHNGCIGISFQGGNGCDGLSIPEEYDFKRVKRKHSRKTKKLFKNADKRWNKFHSAIREGRYKGLSYNFEIDN